jgi:hypothetical protein
LAGFLGDHLQEAFAVCDSGKIDGADDAYSDMDDNVDDGRLDCELWAVECADVARAIAPGRIPVERTISISDDAYRFSK